MESIHRYILVAEAVVIARSILELPTKLSKNYIIKQSAAQRMWKPYSDICSRILPLKADALNRLDNRTREHDIMLTLELLFVKQQYD